MVSCTFIGILVPLTIIPTKDCKYKGGNIPSSGLIGRVNPKPQKGGRTLNPKP